MRWAELLLAVLVGVAAGIGGYTFVSARGASYLTDNPAACANGHIDQTRQGQIALRGDVAER